MLTYVINPSLYITAGLFHVSRAGFTVVGAPGPLLVTTNTGYDNSFLSCIILTKYKLTFRYFGEADTSTKSVDPTSVL
jgi:hypothetical protein